jgi:predicted regulator of Ras-like GTPase activity (Roadblock/LC7/MglB family)
MNEDIYSIALKTALTEIQNVCEGIKWSFIFTKDGTIISGNDDKTISPEITKAASSFQSLTEKAGAVGGLEQLLINGNKEKVHVSSIDDIYLVSGISKQANVAYMHSITSIVFPTILRVLKNISGSSGEVSPTPLKSLPSKPLEAEEIEAEEEEIAEPLKLEEPEESVKEKVKIDDCVAKRPNLVAKQPSFFSVTPGPVSGPQKNIGTLPCPMDCYKIQGSKRSNHSGLMTRADHEKGHPPGFLFKGVQRCATQVIGF